MPQESELGEFGRSRRGALKKIGAAMALALLPSGLTFADAGKSGRPKELRKIKEYLAAKGFTQEELKVFDDKRIRFFKATQGIGGNENGNGAASPAMSEKAYKRYRRKFITNDTIERGKKFLEEHMAELKRAEREHNADPGKISAILNIETSFGRNTGSTPVINALVSRYKYAIDEKTRQEVLADIEGLLTISKLQKKSPFDYVGSISGAIGAPQYMPSNLVKYYIHEGRDFDFNDLREAIKMVAVYYDHKGWKPPEELHNYAQYPNMVYNRSRKYSRVVDEYAVIMRQYWRGLLFKNQKWER